MAGSASTHDRDDRGARPRGARRARGERPRARRARTARLAGGLALLLLPGCAALGILPPLPEVAPDGVVHATRAPVDVRPVSGVVFHDADGDGVRDAGERGLAGVRVSNGVEVVRTDADGRYRLELPRGGAVFVIKPRDWRPPPGAGGVPRFAVLDRPEGTPDAGLRFVPGTAHGPAPPPLAPDAVDFPLEPHPEPDRFDAIAIADPQPYDTRQLAWYARDVLAELPDRGAEMGLLLGDLVGDDLTLFEPLNALHALVGIPWYPVMGNHDVDQRAPDDAGSAATWTRIYGPPDYAFQVARVHFVVLDDVVWGGGPRVGPPDNDHYTTGFRDDQLRFLENLLATVPPDDLVVVAMHIPLARSVDGDRVEPQRILELLARHPRSLSISGHSHVLRHRFFDARDGYAPPGGGEHQHFTAGAASGGRWRGVLDETGVPHATMRDGAPNGYAVLEFDGADYAIRYQAARGPAAWQMNVVAPDRVAPGERADVTVNVFNGSERSRVEMRVDDGEWRELKREWGRDPMFEEARAREFWQVGPSLHLHDPAVTGHLWVGALPADLPAGAHWIEVRAIDPSGRVDRARRPIRVD